MKTRKLLIALLALLLISAPLTYLRHELRVWLCDIDARHVATAADNMCLR